MSLLTSIRAVHNKLKLYVAIRSSVKYLIISAFAK